MRVEYIPLYALLVIIYVAMAAGYIYTNQKLKKEKDFIEQLRIVRNYDTCVAFTIAATFIVAFIHWVS